MKIYNNHISYSIIVYIIFLSIFNYKIDKIKLKNTLNSKN